MSEAFRLEEHPSILMTPRVVAPYGWVGHIPFAYLAVDLLRPATVVELGTHSGNSYLAFCQAVQALDLNTRCWAVDSWEGDDHASRYGDEVYDALRGRHDPIYGGFSTLLRQRFEEAVHQFDDGSVDLLHIDGLHTYDAVRQDFETWQRTLSSRAVVLLHDTNVEGRGFGVRAFFDELASRFATFDFLHSNGLGVIAVGADVPRAFLAFLKQARESPTSMRRFFEGLAGRLVDSSGDLASSSIADQQPLISRIYYRSHDEAYDEATSVAVRVDRLDGVIHLRFRLPPHASPDYLRLDFSDFPGVYTLEAASLIRGEAEVRVEHLAGRLGYVHGELLPSLQEHDVRMVGFDNDPYLEFEVARSMACLAGEGPLTVVASVRYEAALVEPAQQAFLSRQAVSLQTMVERARERAQWGDLAVAQARQFGELMQRMANLEKGVERLSSRSLWSRLRGSGR